VDIPSQLILEAEIGTSQADLARTCRFGSQIRQIESDLIAEVDDEIYVAEDEINPFSIKF